MRESARVGVPPVSQERWEAIVADLKVELDAKHHVRESALRQCRILIQTASKCIKHIHRRQFPEAESLLAEAKQIAETARDGLRPFPDLMYAGYLQDAEKEYVEAAVCLAIVRGDELPLPTDLGVSPASYLNGVGEAASECRRYVLDEMRQRRLGEAEAMMATMEAVYDDLTTFDYPDSLTGGLRRTCDALRAVVERTRSDLTMTSAQQVLLDELLRHRESSH